MAGGLLRRVPARLQPNCILSGWLPLITGSKCRLRGRLDGRLVVRWVIEHDRRSGAGIHPELEDVWAAVVADWVEEPAGGTHRGQLDIGVQDGLLVPSRPRQDLAGGMDDHAIAGLYPAFVVVIVGPKAVAMRKVDGNLVDMQTRVDPDDIAAAFQSDVSHGGDPAVAGREGWGRPDIHALAVEVVAGQGHEVLPAGQPGQPAVRRFDDWQRGAVPQ